MPIQTTLELQRAQWILNALNYIKPESMASKGFVSWVASKHKNFGITLAKGFTVQEEPGKKKGQGNDEAFADPEDTPASETLREKRNKRFLEIKKVLSDAVKVALKKSDLVVSDAEKNLAMLASRINLSPLEQNIVLFYMDVRGNETDKLLWVIRPEADVDSYFLHVSRFFNIAPETLKEKLSTASVLRNFISFNAAGFGYDYDNRARIDLITNGAYAADKNFVKVISEPSSSADAIISKLLGPTPTTDLTLDDFAYLGKDKLDYFVEILRGAVEGNGKPRKNHSLYGEPGVGKTELTAVIAKHLGVSLYAIGLSHLDSENVLSDNISEPSRADRLLAWRRAAYLVKAANMKCIFVLDEADDVLRDPNEDKSSNRASKGYLNWLLDNNNVPTIFITNNIHIFEDSTVRRILPALRIPSAPQDVQARILINYAKRYGLSVSDEQAEILTKRHSDLTSAVIETLLYKTSRRRDIKDNPQAHFPALEIAFEENDAALNQGTLPVPQMIRSTRGFDARLNTAQINIPELTADFSVAHSLAGLSVCLYGVQGAGKRTLMQYMAEKLGLKTKFFDYTNLYGPAGFKTDLLKDELEESLRERSMLVFNDISRLLQSSDWGKLDSHPFFLAIEGHGLPIGATLHDCDEIDIEPRQLFRLTGQFTFAARISALDTEGQRVALEKIVGLSEEGAEQVISRMGHNTSLVVGDFVRVAQQMKFRPSLRNSPDAVFNALQYNAMQAGQPSLGSPAGF